MTAVFASAFWTTLSSLGFASNTSVRAEVAWSGDCDEPASLAEEMRAREAELLAPGSSRETLRLSVGVQPGESGGFVATLILRDEAGAREQREVETGTCQELRQVVAWMLVVLAKERRLPTSFAAFPSEGNSTLVQPAPAPAPAASAPRAVIQRADLGRAPGPLRVNESRVGSAFVTGFGFTSRPALGPLVFLEHRPSSAWLPDLRLSVFQLSSFTIRRADTAVSVERLSARVEGWVRSGWDPVRFGGALEVGRLLSSGSGTGLRVRREDTATWVALGLVTELEAELVPGFLGAQLSAGGYYAPYQYGFEYSSGEAFSSSERLELRGQLGLSARL